MDAIKNNQCHISQEDAAGSDGAFTSQETGLLWTGEGSETREEGEQGVRGVKGGRGSRGSVGTIFWITEKIEVCRLFPSGDDLV